MTLSMEVPAETDENVGLFLRPALGLMATEQWQLAFESFGAALGVLVSSQPRGVRFHKGFPLHNMGLCKFWLGQAKLARDNFLLAFIEDVLSGNEDSWLGMPAALNLVGIFSIPTEDLRLKAAAIRSMNAAGVDVADPRMLFETLGLGKSFEQEQSLALSPAKRKAGRFPTEWNRRVFVGGSYSGQVAELNYIAAVCREAGYDPVIEFEFEVPPELVHHHGLMLLHECRLAIFEVSTAAGQLMELERARDYNIAPLVLYQGMPAHGHISSMVETLLARLSLIPERYGTMPELETLVRRYLG